MLNYVCTKAEACWGQTSCSWSYKQLQYYGCWEQNRGFLQEQQVFLTAELYLSSLLDKTILDSV